MNLEKLITENNPNDHARRILADTRTVLMVGVSGAGKDTIIRELVARGGYHPLVTSTTREMRVNNGVPEQDGVEYHFLTIDRAEEYLLAGKYIEASLVHGYVYGLTVDELERAHDSGKIAITDMDPQGAEKYKTLDDSVITIFVLPPSHQELMARLDNRYESQAAFLEAWPTRRESAIAELVDALEKPYYQFVINDDLSDAVEACDRIAHGEFTTEDEQTAGRIAAHSLLRSLQSENH